MSCWAEAYNTIATAVFQFKPATGACMANAKPGTVRKKLSLNIIASLPTLLQCEFQGAKISTKTKIACFREVLLSKVQA
jgi:hypothetical protein